MRERQKRLDEILKRGNKEELKKFIQEYEELDRKRREQDMRKHPELFKKRRNPMARARRKPYSITAKKYGKFIHEVIKPRIYFPKNVKFRTTVTDAHRVVVGYWGRPVGGVHPHYAIHKILHPKKRGEPCKLKDRLRVKGVKSLVLGREYRVKKSLPKLTGKRRGKKLIRKNPYKRWYVGFRKTDRRPEIFSSSKKPTPKTHGRFYGYVIGPTISFEDATRIRNMHLQA